MIVFKISDLHCQMFSFCDWWYSKYSFLFTIVSKQKCFKKYLMQYDLVLLNLKIIQNALKKLNSHNL